MRKSILSKFLPANLHPRRLAGQAFARLQAHGRVLGGPFRGMRYGDVAVGSLLPPKIFGTYEKELWPWMEQIISRQPKTIVDVGAAEGYFAIGLATRLPTTSVVAFELTEQGRKQLEINAQLNSCSERLSIFGECSPDNFHEVAATRKPEFVIVDVEGAEEAILSHDNVPVLRNSVVIVELHEWVRPDIKELLKQRFQETHTALVVQSRQRKLTDLPREGLAGLLFGRWWTELIDERRPSPMEWLILQPTMRQ